MYGEGKDLDVGWKEGRMRLLHGILPVEHLTRPGASGAGSHTDSDGPSLPRPGPQKKVIRKRINTFPRLMNLERGHHLNREKKEIRSPQRQHQVRISPRVESRGGSLSQGTEAFEDVPQASQRPSVRRGARRERTKKRRLGC